MTVIPSNQNRRQLFAGLYETEPETPIKSDQAELRLAWGILGALIEGGILPLPTTDYEGEGIAGLNIIVLTIQQAIEMHNGELIWNHIK
jgi:hypothetical protein